MKKSDRQKVFDKFGGRCAYTGKELQPDWQVDHITPIRQYRLSINVIKDQVFYDEGIKHIDNLVPALRIINHYKRGKDLELFRAFILKLHLRLKKYPQKSRVQQTIKKKQYVFEVASHFGITVDKPFEGKFYFETLI